MYHIQINPVPHFIRPQFDDSTLTGTSLTMALNRGWTYYWRIRSRNDNDRSAWSETFSFTTSLSQRQPVVLHQPADNAAETRQPVNLSWRTASGARRYQVQVDTMSSFIKPALDTTLNQTYLSITPLWNKTRYFWRARAEFDIGWGDWSNPFSFTLSLAQLQPVTLNQPLNEAVETRQPVNLSWRTVSGAARYQVQAATAPDFQNPVIDQYVAAAPYLAVSLPRDNTRYFWRVRAEFTGVRSDWSSPWSFMLKTGSTTSVAMLGQEIPDSFALLQNYPNPFNPSTVIRFDLPRSTHAELAIYDLQGRMVERLLSGEYPAGRYAAEWNATRFPSGVYFYRLTTESFTAARRLMLVK